MAGNKQVFSAAMDAANHYLWDNHWMEALQAYQQALAEFPEDITVRSGLGFCYMQTKQWPKALEEYAHILKSDPCHIIALSKTAELYGILGQRADAYCAYLHLADLYSQASQGTRAEAAWLKAVQLSPGNPEPHERLANYYFEKKDIVQMIHQRLAAAQDYLLHNELALARQQCQAVLHVDATNTQAQQMLALVQTTGNGLSNPFASVAGVSSVDLEKHADNPVNSISADQTNSNSYRDNPVGETALLGNISGGNTSIMNNIGSAGNYGGVGNTGSASTMAGHGRGVNSAAQPRITANQVAEALQQAQVYQDQGRFNDAINLCEQILASGFDRPDARYFLGWLYQEQQRWDDAIQQFQALLNDPDYALSCYYSLGQCYRACGDLPSATVHFDEAVDRVNLDALTAEESDQLVQLCQEAAEAHRLLGEQDQAFTVYNALLGFLRSRGWNDKVTQVEFMIQQAQNSPAPDAPFLTSETHLSSSEVPELPTVAINAASITSNPLPQAAPSSTSGELPDWLTGILNDDDKSYKANKSVTPPPVPKVAPVVEPPAPIPSQAPASVIPAAVESPMPTISSSSWLTDSVSPNTTRVLPLEPPVPPVPPVGQPPAAAIPVPQPPAAAIPVPQPPAITPQISSASPIPASVSPLPLDIFMQPSLDVSPIPPIDQSALSILGSSFTPSPPVQPKGHAAEDLLSQIAGKQAIGPNNVADAVLASTASLAENVRVQVVRSMQDIQKYISHGLLTPAKEECLRVVNIAPQYLDVHQVLCEIYVREGNLDQAIPKYAILVDTYIANGRMEDAIATYRRILQLDSNNITYRMRLINLLSAQGHTEDLLQERTLAAESYLRLGYVDRAMTELEQALQENPTNVPTRLNYALALQKLGHTHEAVAEYQRVLQVDPRNITALVRWHIGMITGSGTPRATSLEVLSRIRWQLRGLGQKYADFVIREYLQALDLYPNNADIHYALGQIYQQCGQYDRALDSYLLGIRDNSVEILARASVQLRRCLHRAGLNWLCNILNRLCSWYGSPPRQWTLLRGPRVRVKMVRNIRLPKWRSLCSLHRPINVQAARSRCRLFCAR